MKKLSSLLSIILSVLILSSCNMSSESSEPTKEEAKSFKTHIEISSLKVEGGIKQFAEALYPDAQVDRKAALETIKKTISEAKASVSGLKDIKGGETLKSSTLALMNAYEGVMNNQYAEVIKLMTEQELTSEVADKMKEYHKNAQESVDPLYQTYLKEMEAFEKKFHLEE
ncbi:MAG: hypothetical protein K2X86_01870 [Cytophagaceae bacterium]|nr:hypothetical protein [Cytophagaceae bacterium]